VLTLFRPFNPSFLSSPTLSIAKFSGNGSNGRDSGRVWTLRIKQCSPYTLLSNLFMSTSSPSRGRYTSVVKDYPSPPHSRSSSESSLRALELSQGAEAIELRQSRNARANSISLFQFQDELLPLSLSEVERPDNTVVKKTIGLWNGESGNKF